MKAKELAEMLMQCPDANVFLKDWSDVAQNTPYTEELLKAMISVEPLWNAVVIDIRD